MLNATDPAAPRACALVVGVGAIEGIGGAVAIRFAREGLCVHVVGRTASKLDAVVAHIREAGGHAVPIVNALATPEDVAAVFSEIHRHGQQLVVAVYNAAYLNVPKRFLSTPPSFIEGNWRVTCLAGILVGQASARAMIPHGRGTLIFTGATASLRGKPLFAAFASAKAALRSFALSLSAEVAPLGIHVAHVVIDGVVDGDRGKSAFGGLGRLLMRFVKHRNGALLPAQVAENYWQIHLQAKGAWAHELELRPFKEPF